jgi:protein-L-isoaspartate(D-aspartate) O-methyltransferase
MKQLHQSSPLERMIQQQLVERGIDDPRVLDAIRSVPRELFFSPQTRAQAHADRAAPIGHGQTISQPYIVALMTQRLDLHPTHSVLEIGTGSGYQTAVLAQLAAVVYTVERVKPLLDDAFERLMSLNVRNIHLRWGDGTIGWPEAAPFERIIITAGAPEIPESLLLTQLQDNGIALLPVGDIHEQMLVEVRRQGDSLHRADICPCRFVKLIGKAAWPD